MVILILFFVGCFCFGKLIENTEFVRNVFDHSDNEDII